MVSLAPVNDGQVIVTNKLRLVYLSSGDREMDAPCLALGARKDAKGNLELLVYGKDAAPLLRLPLKAIAATQDVPIDLGGQRKDNGDGVLALRFVGKYEAALTVRLTGQ